VLVDFSPAYKFASFKVFYNYFINIETMLLRKIMSKSSFNRVYLYYDFLEKYIIRDYKIALELIHNNLNLKKNLNVVDIGGGTGAIAKSIIDEVNSVWIVDNSKQMLKRLKNHYTILKKLSK